MVPYARIKLYITKQHNPSDYWIHEQRLDHISFNAAKRLLNEFIFAFCSLSRIWCNQIYVHLPRLNTRCVPINQAQCNRHFFQRQHRHNFAIPCWYILFTFFVINSIITIAKAAILIVTQKHYVIQVSIIKMLHVLATARCLTSINAKNRLQFIFLGY